MTHRLLPLVARPTDKEPLSSSLHVCGLPALSRIDEEEEGKEGGDKGGQIGKEGRSLGVEEIYYSIEHYTIVWFFQLLPLRPVPAGFETPGGGASTLVCICPSLASSGKLKWDLEQGLSN